MKKSFVSALMLCLLAFLTFPLVVLGQETDGMLSVSFIDKQGAPLRKASTTMPDVVVLNGTGDSKVIEVSTVGLTQDITVAASSGLEVSPTVIAAGEENAQLTVVNRSTLRQQSGRIILRSGDIRLRINVEALGTPLPVKDLSQNPAYTGGNDENKTFEGFAPGNDGFTLEVKARTNGEAGRVLPFAVSDDGVGFKGYIAQRGIGLMNSTGVFVSEKGISNPANGGTFYNDDGEYHTYRYAVTPDERIFVYRDGMPVDTMRLADLALQPEWSTSNGDVEPNLIRNGDFEGEWDFSESQNITKFIEGWDVYPYDQYNSYQDIKSDERSNDVDQNNHALEIHRYMWNDGWAAAEISQIVDVAPNEVYSFSCLAKGGLYDGKPLGAVRIQDLQNDANRVTMDVTSDSYQTYAADFTTQANTKQVRVAFTLERAKWGASVSGFRIDDVRLTGVKRLQTAQVGFDNQGADIAYFNYDTTGAFAPPFASLTTSTDELTINGTGESATFTVSAANLTGDITLNATPGFEVSPKVLTADANGATVTVRNLSTLISTTGKVILRAGDKRKTVRITATGTPLPVKDLSHNPAYTGGSDGSKTFDGFTPGNDGFTLEVKARTDGEAGRVLPFAVSDHGVGFKGYIAQRGIGLMNSTGVFVSEKGISNPANGGTFYNDDGEYHTYRYAVTPDERIFVYRDGMPVDTMRLADLALQPEWSTSNGEVEPNLIRNGDFEGEWDFSESQNITKFIEGWDVYPYDQYNSYQDIKSDERSNDVDQNNHALEIHRYMWNDGWAAAEISQIVDVAPNEVYSFSCLAKGGLYDGKPLGAVRIQDLQNDANRVTMDVTSDSYQTYAADFTTQATTRQVRVAFTLERAKWGASVSGFRIDDVRLTGVKRLQTAQVGFDNQGADIAYFNYDTTGAFAPPFASLTTSADELTINGTGETGTFTVSAENLTGDITINATPGFEVSPKVLTADANGATVTVRNLSTLIGTTGKVILRAGDKRKTVRITATGTPLPVKDLSQDPAYTGGSDGSKTFDGFTPGNDGFTLEVKARTDGEAGRVLPFAVSEDGVGFKGYIAQRGIGLMNSTGVFVSEKGISNPANGGTFYNDDGEYHTYRYAVTPDERIFVYRDGMPVDTMRLADLALQPEWSTSNGEVEPNLIRNGDFEGEWDFSESQNITKFIEGWDVYPYDQYNSYQDIKSDERSNDVDQNNHALEIHRYMWNDGWAAAEISQIVDVAPNEVYSFSCLAKGGLYDGKPLGAVRIQDLQNDANRVTMDVTSDSYQTYAADFTTQATTKQVRVAFTLERAKWGASVSGFRIDDVKLTGVKRLQTAQVGFDNKGADIAYFNYDTTGAFAPPFASLTTSADELTINGTGESATFNVSSENLMGDISVSATHGFAVSPTTIKAGKNATITVTNLTTLNRNIGRVILRSGDVRTYVNLTGIGSELEVKDISQNPIYAGGSNDYYMEFVGFNPTEENGYTVEIKAKTDDGRSYVHPFGITEQGVGFKGYITSTSMGLYNGKGIFVSEKGMSNPANGGTFYNTDGLFHTYRYAVTPDRRVFVYRDGLPIDTMRLADLALQPEWSIATGKVARNMIKNGDFEGEYNFNSSRNITDRIEGWDVYPYDQYNSYQDISREERSNEIDQNNHVLEVHRYMWNDGWAAAEISQIVDVAPNEVYSFSCLAKGGLYDGKPLGSVRIQDLQNDDNKVTLNVNSDSYKTYAVDFETKATTQQVRLVFMLERAKWGASVSAFKIDDVKMKGFSRVTSQKVGFENLDGEIEYFNYDATGAYAPLLPGLTAQEVVDAIKTANDQIGKLRVRLIDGQLQVLGIEESSRIVIYSADGHQVALLPNVLGDAGMALPGRGTYIVGVWCRGKKQVLKIIY